MRNPPTPSSYPQPHRAALTTPVVKLDVVALVTGGFINVFPIPSLALSFPQEDNASFAVFIMWSNQTKMSCFNGTSLSLVMICSLHLFS